MPRLPRKGSDEPENTPADETVAEEQTSEIGDVPSHVPPLAGDPVVDEAAAEEPPTASRGAIRTPAEQIEDSRGDDPEPSRVSVVNESAPATDRSDDDEY